MDLIKKSDGKEHPIYSTIKGYLENLYKKWLILWIFIGFYASSFFLKYDKNK